MAHSREAEPLFPRVFIFDVIAKFKKASEEAEEDNGFFRNDEVFDIIEYMKQLKVEQNGIGGERGKNFAGLLALINNAITRSKAAIRTHSLLPDSHPYVAALNSLKTTVIDIVRLAELKDAPRPEDKKAIKPVSKSAPVVQSRVSINRVDDEKKAAPRAEGLVKTISLSRDADPERLFPEFFVKRIERLFRQKSGELGQTVNQQTPLLNPLKTTSILNFMRALYVDGKGNVTFRRAEGEGKEEQKYPDLRDDHQFRNLLHYIDRVKNEHEARRKWLCGTSYGSTLDEVKQLIIQYTKLTAEMTVKELREARAAAEQKISQRRKAIAKDVATSAACLVWSVVQQPITFFNCCRTNDRDCRCCPAVADAPGKIAICDAPGSIDNLCSEISAESKAIDDVRVTGPMRQTM